MADRNHSTEGKSQYLQVPTMQDNDRSASPSGTSPSGSGGTSPSISASRNGSSTRLLSSASASGRSSPGRNTNIGYIFTLHHDTRGTTHRTWDDHPGDNSQDRINVDAITSGDGGGGQEQPRPHSPRMEYGNSPDGH
ncbi:hypothetical protein L486_01945 [Kwoniella mangroviensis CBS 10435]|uniref:Uncharacterized protein n=1 Tax=Kwoniella mangroviensis CBS 10435 TaxID=1331196 RepID=A0A1B9J3B3_9TREE|nr:hypothetical protein L486_01945 [Kwoniella mangroviensis CBS 10435]